MKKLTAILLLTIINTTFAADAKKESREFCDVKCDPTDLVTSESRKLLKYAFEIWTVFIKEVFAFFPDDENRRQVFLSKLQRKYLLLKDRLDCIRFTFIIY